MTDPSQLTNEQLMAIAGPPAGPRPAAPRSNQPRGIRNNNPGNIEDGSFARSLPGYAGSDGRFAIFNSPDAGNAAKSRLLGSYIERGFDTPASIINRWAPPSDNNPTSQYADYVARRAGVGVNDRVTADQIPLIAQAISEFENGNTVPVGGDLQFTSAPQDLTALSNEDLMAIAGQPSAADIQPRTGDPISGALQLVQRPWTTREPERIIPAAPVEYDEEGREIITISAGVRQNPDGSYTIPETLADGSTALYRVSPQEYRQWAGKAEDDREERERRMDPNYRAEFQQALARSENVPAIVSNLFQGQSLGALPLLEGALGWLDPNVEGGDRGVASQAARDASRERLNRLMADDPLGTFGAQFAGSLFTPGLQAGGNYIAGAQGGARAIRAGQVGTGYGFTSGAISGEGNVADRLDDAALGGVVGFGAGAIGQRALDRWLPAMANRAPSQARQLSRQGVDLTPAQILSGVPGVGQVARWTEQAGSSIPVAGVAMRGAERRSIESFDRAAINRALEPLGETIPRRARGREAIRAGDDIISNAYNAELNPITINPDPQINARISAALNPRNLSRTARTTLQDTAADIQARMQGPITGQEWKQIDSELSGLINTTANGDAASRPLSRALRDVREVVGDALEQASPGSLERIRRVDEAFGNFALIRRAASNPTTGRNDELFTPSNLNSVLARSEGRAYGRGEARLQDLVDPAEAVMAGTLNNSGTPERAALATVALGGAATGAVVNPAVAIPTIVGVSAAYSRPAQAALNAIYRATDSQTAREGVELLARLAQRSPALLPYYEGALRYALSLAPTQSQAIPPAQSTAPRPIPVQ